MRRPMPVDGHDVPVPHFGVVLDDGRRLARARGAGGEAAERALRHRAARIRFAGQPGEQATMFFRDPSGNALEFKAFRDTAKLFATG